MDSRIVLILVGALFGVLFLLPFLLVIGWASS